MSQMTKKAFAASLKKMLEHKPLDKVKVIDITEDCEVNRQTFYYHFKDIYDLVAWCCEEDGKRALQGKKTYQTWQEGFLQIFEVILENKPFILNIYHSVSREQIETYLYQLTYGLLEGVIKEQAQGTVISKEDMQFIAEFYKYSFVGILLDWVKEGMKEEPAQIVEKVSITLNGNIANSVENFSNQH